MQLGLDTFKKERKKLKKEKDDKISEIIDTQRIIKTEVIESTDTIEKLKETLKN